MAEPKGDVDQARVASRLLAMGLVKGITIADAAALLSRAGLERQEIALVCGTTPDVISVRLAERKRPKNARARGKR